MVDAASSSSPSSISGESNYSPFRGREDKQVKAVGKATKLIKRDRGATSVFKSGKIKSNGG